MKTLGQTIRQYREKSGVTSAHLSKLTKVPLPFLEALEAERYQDLPNFTFTQGYVLLLAQEIGLGEETALALLRRDIPTPVLTAQRSRPRRWREKLISPRFLSLAVLSCLLLVCASVLLFQWQKLSKPPKLVILEPSTADIAQSPVQVAGQTDPNNTVTINTEVVSLDPRGNFRHSLELPEGERALVIQATDHRGRQNEEILFITVEP